MCPRASFAQVTGPADAGRVEDRIQVLPRIETQKALPKIAGKVENQPAPEGSEEIHLTLKEVNLVGGDFISPLKLHEAYDEFLDKDITLDKIWVIAGRITAILQNDGYFLSRVYVPQQEIEDGKITLNVVEGYISEVNLDNQAKSNVFIDEWTQRVVDQKPLKIKDLESLLLRLNDLPGQNVRAVLELPQAADAPEGSTRLSVLSAPKPIVARTTIDNYGSRYLGPAELTQQISLALIPNQRTDLTFLTSLPTDELRYGGIRQNITLDYDWAMDLSASVTGAHPGDTLKIQDIVNKSKNYGIGFTNTQIRQRSENLSFRYSFEGRDIDSKILGNFPLSTDHIRMLRAGASYQNQDENGGYNISEVTVSRGLGLFGSSKAGDDDLSRSQAKPGRSKIEASYSRIQSLPHNISAVAGISGQLASGPLYASEEFGYGGQNFGRAYDSSELTGDSGIASSLEFRYQGLPAMNKAYLMPYVFYDIGKVWNYDSGQTKPQSGASAGGGLRIATDFGINANFGLAFPLTRPIAAPLNGNKQGPRYMFQLSYDF